nr:class I SAM-dependent methyltransferase [Micromonospora sp. DSM 115978]
AFTAGSAGAAGAAVADLASDGQVDCVVLAFVLHELDPADRVGVLVTAAEAVAPGGSVGILEWGLPSSSTGARLWRSAVRAIEPAVAHDVLDDGLDVAVTAAAARVSFGFSRVADRRLAGGRARAVVLRRQLASA